MMIEWMMGGFSSYIMTMLCISFETIQIMTASKTVCSAAQPYYELHSKETIVACAIQETFNWVHPLSHIPQTCILAEKSKSFSHWLDTNITRAF